MAGDHDEHSDPLPTPDPTVMAVFVGVGLVSALALIATVVLIATAHDDLLRVVS